MLSGNSLASISFRTRVSIAVQTSSRKSDRVSSDRIESQMRRTSGNGNSCDSIKVSHLGRKEANFVRSRVTPFFVVPECIATTDFDNKDGKFIPEREILRFNFLKNKLFFNVRINNFDLLHQFGHHPVDSTLSLVQGFDEKIPNVRHQVGEAKETVCLGVFYK